MAYTNHLDIESWLDTLPTDLICAFATRAALRAVPCQGFHIKQVKQTQATEWQMLLLPYFRALSASVCGSLWPEEVKDLRTGAWTQLEQSFPSLMPAGYALATVGTNLAYAADIRAGRAAAAAYAATTVLWSDTVFILSSHGNQNGPLGDLIKPVYLWEREYIQNNASAVQLMNRPLWPDDFKFGDSFICAEWERLKAYLHEQKKGWDAWTNWYETFLNSQSLQLRIKEVEIPRATFPEEYETSIAGANRFIESHCNYPE